MRKPALAAIIASLAACSSSNSSKDAPPTGTPQLLAVRGNVIVAQHVPLATGEQIGVFPGHANYWDLDADFSLRDGGDNQFRSALWLAIGTLATSPPTADSLYGGGEAYTLDMFPLDQNYDELQFLGPLAKKADGVLTAVAAAADANAGYDPPLAGTCSAYLIGTSDSRLSQPITLPAVSGGATLTLGWSSAAVTYGGYLGATSAGVSYQPHWRVAIYAQNGDLLAWALPTTQSDLGDHTVDLTPYAGQRVTVSFELRSNGTYAVVDNVSVVDSRDPSANLLANGDFETCDLTGWTANDTGEATGIGSGVRNVGGLDVKRFFYTVPGKKWARFTDVLSNSGATPVTQDVVHVTNLGSYTAGRTYETPSTGGKAITSWDTFWQTRDVGLAYGSDERFYGSVTAIDSFDGKDGIFFVRHVTIPADQKIVLVHFIVMDGTDTGRLATTTDLTAKATEIDDELAQIVAGVRTDPQYLDGMTADQIAAIANW